MDYKSLYSSLVVKGLQTEQAIENSQGEPDEKLVKIKEDIISLIRSIEAFEIEEH